MSTKEEQKQHLIDLMNQQTLEEAAEKSFNDSEYLIDKPKYTLGFIEGAKWQAQRMYSEEEVLKLLITFSDDRTFLKEDVAIQWFDKNKKQ